MTISEGDARVILRRLDALHDAIAALRRTADVELQDDAERAYDQVRSSVERALGVRGREVDHVREDQPKRAGDPPRPSSAEPPPLPLPP